MTYTFWGRMLRPTHSLAVPVLSYVMSSQNYMYDVAQIHSS